jgi:25S rRNA (uracil2634-N3)-methyltransferase
MNLFLQPDARTLNNPRFLGAEPFILRQISNGQALFVGEGNMSFARSLIDLNGGIGPSLVVTTYENSRDIDAETKNNAIILEDSGAKIIYGVDAENIETDFLLNPFDTIIFQFPNVGSREPVDGKNPNAALIGGFLKSARPILQPDGKIIITHVDSSYYHGQFQIEMAAKENYYHICFVKDFDPAEYPGYVHTNTLNDESALDHYDQFVTWVLCLDGADE